MSVFDPCSVPLCGRQLIEASAGTGKTHALADLHLRLLVEPNDVEVRHILVLTFTNAAAAELRERLRARLLLAQSRLCAGQREQDPVLSRMSRDEAELRRRLARALCDFDAAPIGTIHSFCLRVLQEHPVEAGVPLALRVAPPSADFDSALIRDVVRAALEEATRPGTSELALSWACHHLSPASLARIIREARAGLSRVLPDMPPLNTDATALERRFEAALDRARTLWAQFGDDLREHLAAAPLHQSRYGPRVLSSRFEAAEIWLDSPAPPDGRDESFPLTPFTTHAVRAAVRKGQEALVPSHPLLEALDELHAATLELGRLARTLALAIRIHAARLAPAARRRRLEQLEALDYDDLTLRVLDALRGPGGQQLAERLAREYRIALVDEAQDTDPAQHEILEALHAQGTVLCLIGDPKQSIYAFRGADIFAYARAAAHATRHSLDRNWRAAPALVRAVQTAFARPRAFGWPFITLPDVQPADGAPTLRLERDGRSPPPCHIWLVQPPDSASLPIGAVTGRRQVADFVAADIASLLSPASTARLVGPGGDRSVEPADIAVLVTRHVEAAEVLAALARAGVPAVTSSQASVFASDDAIMLRMVLDALARPRREDLVRGAALTPIFGLDPAILSDPASAEWTAFMNRWVAAADLWPRRGVREALERLLAGEAAFERLLERPDGERRATNLRHLADLLGVAESERRMGPAALLAWFDAQIAASDTSAEETELQLDSDARRVRIATIHHSKGLQYPIVYCPYLWALPHSGRDPTDAATCHHETTGTRILDVGSPELEQHRSREQLERFLESVRLAYVAVTRAQAACTVVWGPFRGASTSPLAWLWHAGLDDEPGNEVASVRQWDVPRIASDLSRLVASAPDAIAVVSPPATSSPHPARAPSPMQLGPALEFHRSLDDGWRITSFSSLRAGSWRAADLIELPETDPPGAPPLPPGETCDPKFRFPAGPAAGTVLHQLLESVDFRHVSRDLVAAQAADALRLHGLDPAWAPVAADLVLAALTTPLDELNLRLCDLDPSRCTRELPFLMRLGPITARDLNDRLGRTAQADQTQQRPAPLVFDPMHGFLKGFIDLVFEAHGRWYLLDYKSNLLGSSPDDYCPARLAAEMATADYELQALLYSVALRRLALARGILEAEFADRWGGCFYLFLRGLSPDTGHARGVWHWRPDPAQLAELSELLDGGGAP